MPEQPSLSELRACRDAAISARAAVAEAERAEAVAADRLAQARATLSQALGVDDFDAAAVEAALAGRRSHLDASVATFRQSLDALVEAVNAHEESA